jgi:general secretion pathway protein F
MARFQYKAATSTGEVVVGEMDAPSRDLAVEKLRREGQLPIRVQPMAARLGAARRPRAFLESRRVSQADAVLIARELATLLQAGLPLDRALSIMADLGPEGARKNVLLEVLEAVRGGVTLAEAMERYPRVFPSYYVGMVRAGEAGGTLDSILARLADSLERAHALRENIRSAMYYPIVVLLVAGGTLVVLLTVVIPKFKPMFDDMGTAMPLPMAVLLTAGQVLTAWWWLIALAMLAVILVTRYYVSRPGGQMRLHEAVRQLPLFGGLITKVEIARFCRTLGTLLASGVNILPAFSIALSTISNRAIASAIEEVSARLKRGEGLAASLLESGVVPRMASQLVLVGEESGQLETMLVRVAETYDEQVRRTVERSVSLLVPAVTIGLGLMVAGIVGSLLSGIMSMYDLPFQG